MGFPIREDEKCRSVRSLDERTGQPSLLVECARRCTYRADINALDASTGGVGLQVAIQCPSAPRKVVLPTEEHTFERANVGRYWESEWSEGIENGWDRQSWKRGAQDIGDMTISPTTLILGNTMHLRLGTSLRMRRPMSFAPSSRQIPLTSSWSIWQRTT